MNTVVRRSMVSRSLESCVAALTGSFVTIFMLHRPIPQDGSFNGVPEALLEECLDYAVRSGYDFLSVDEVVNRAIAGKRIERPTVCFTLDDGYADQASRLVPILLKYRAKPTLFVITDFIDGKSWPWDAQVAYAVMACKKERVIVGLEGSQQALELASFESRVAARRLLIAHAKELKEGALSDFLAELEMALGVAIPPQPPPDYSPASWEQLRHFEAEGLRVGSHACSHLLFSAMEKGRILVELAQSKARLGEELRAPSEVFCYPSGTVSDFDREDEALVQKACYRGAVSTISETSYMRHIRKNPYRIARIGFPHSIERFTRYVSWVEVLRSKLPV